MLSQKTLLSLLAVLVPVGVFAVTTFTEPATKDAVPAPVSPLKGDIAAATAEASSNTTEPLPNKAGDAITVSATPRSEKNSTLVESIIEAFTEPYRDISVAAAEMGTLSVIHVREGDRIRKGDVIATMNDEVLQASLEVARRSMKVAGAIQSAQADLDMKKSEQKKLTELRERNHASQQEVDRIATELRVSEARLLSVREDIEIKELEFRRIESQLKQRSVLAPMDGVVTELFREEGEFVSPSDPTIARLVQLDALLVVFSVPLSRRNEVTNGQKVEIQIGLAGESAEGIVEYVSPTSDSSNSSVRVKVRLPNSDARFQSGERAVLVLSRNDSPASPSDQQSPTPVARREP
jgi:RND family efflux transporter MFP subunit